ncbi:5'-adenylylsulfate reductase-like 5 [Diospyros lotus]|uniref:5'-adenylylsulfate reductase-like 5 n=1 Tax=Diospyros lotus TaxID=55363 RepID=UPI0022563794|nr:5'-adenylylsulfate reductase-like 5 [Diospyros lotus]
MAVASRSFRFAISVCLCLCAVISSSPPRFVSSASLPVDICPPRPPLFFLYSISPHCPSSISPLQVDGYYLDKALASLRGNAYISVLFYGSWCPFSQDASLAFEALAYMFPEIKHLAVEYSSAMPSVFSRYGIHSLPSILLVNQTSKMQFRGSKDLQSLVKFYENITGFKPVQYVGRDESSSWMGSGKFAIRSWRRWSSLNEMLNREPYLLFSALYLCLKLVISVFPKVISCFRALWASHVPHLNLEIFGETSQMLGPVLQIINLRMICGKLRLKARNFAERAKNARVWACSLSG